MEPTSEEANRYLARSYLALENPQAAQPYLQTLVESYPDNESYAELLASSERQLTWGVAASQEFEEGLELLDAGQPEQALAAFERATRANPDFRDAFVQAGRTGQALNRPQVAQGFWQRAVELDPQDREAQQALTLTQNQGRYGVQAYSAYQQGTSQYAQGQVAAAQTSFRQAVDANSRYGDAWGWLGRIALEQGDISAAADFYDRARVLEPTNSAYTQGFEQATAQLEAQAEAELEEARLAEQAAAAEAARLEAERLAAEQAAQDEAAQAEAVETEDAATSPETAPEATTPEPSVPPITAEVPDRTPEPTPQPTPQAAAQVNLLATTYTHQDDRLTGSSAYSFFSAPDGLGSLTTPVDYTRGTVYQRLEVLSKPSTEPVRYQLCLVPKNISVKPACSSSELAFSGTGVYENTQPLSSFSNYSGIDWASGIDDVMLVVKDGQGRPVDDAYYVSQGGEALDLDDYFPMQVSFEAVLVPPGADFQGW